MLSPKGVVAILIIIAFMGLYGAHRWVVNSEVKQKEAVMAFAYNQKLLNAQLKAAKTEDELRVNASQLTKDKDGKIASIRNELDRANSLLKSRPQRPKDYTTSSSVGSSCTGRELYQEDGLFLRGEAARAEQIVVERDYWYNQYESARKKLNEQ